MPQRTVLLDTSFVLALENREDRFHARAKELDRELTREGAVFLLHWGIMLEIGDGYARIGRRGKGVELLDRFENEQGFEVASLGDHLVKQGISLFRSRADKEWGLTDCVSFALMTSRGVSEALTADSHFRQAGFKTLLVD